MVEVKGGRILVVDRDASKRATRARMLRDAGHMVFEASHPSDATRVLRQAHPELLVLDATLHDSGSAELHHTLQHEDFHGTMVLKMRSDGTPPDARFSADDVDADTYLVEPVPAGVLVATAHALLRLSRAERALRDTIALEQTARDEADAANRAKDDFLGTLSHELRTPLHAIVGWVALLRTRPFDDKVRAHALEVIDRNARAETALIEDLLDVSRLTLGQLQLTWGPVEILPTVFSALDAIRPTAEAKGVAISTDIALDPDISVRGDATRLRQVFWNLLSNAVKFTPTGGRVDVRAHAANGHAEIEVIDNGRGISAELLSHMFEPFGRADLGSTTSVDRGLGLGLATARALVELHGGGLTAASAGPDQGATFLVTLPHQTARKRTTAPSAVSRDRAASSRRRF